MSNIRVYEFEVEMNKSGNAIEWVTYGPMDDASRTKTKARVKDLMPPEQDEKTDDGLSFTHMNYVWDQIRPHYDAWKTGEEIPETGTPLSAWAGLNKAQVGALKAMSIRTVEELRDMPEGLMMKTHMSGLRELRKQAAAYLDSREATQLAAEKIAADERVAGLEEQVEAMKALLEEKAKQEAAKPKAKAKEAA